MSAVSIFWKEVGLDYGNGKTPEPFGFLLEGFFEGEWHTLVDARENREEKNIDYRTFPDRVCTRVRLTLTRPKKLRVGVVDFAVFGKYFEVRHA